MPSKANQTAARRALFLANKQSRNGCLPFDSMCDFLRGQGIDIVEANCGSAGELSPLITDYRDKVDCVVIAGGDGTLNAAARGISETGLPLGILPTGTANDLARTLELPLDLQAAAAVIAKGRTRQIDMGEVNGHFFFNVASVGLSADLARGLRPEVKRRFGRLSYALTALQVLIRARPFHATLATDKERVHVRTLQISIGNGRYYGGGNMIEQNAQIDDGELNLYSLEFQNVWLMALMLPVFRTGAHGIFREVRTVQGNAFEVLTQHPLAINADGELVTFTPARFTQRHKAVRVYVA